MDTPIERIRQKVRIVPSGDDSGQNMDDIVSTIKRLYNRQVLVPVICEDMYEYRNPDKGSTQSLHSYMVECVISRCGKEIELTEKELEDIVNGGYYGMSLLEAKLGRDIFADLFNSIIDEDENLYRGIGLKNEVVEFLRSCEFPLIITTSCFPILERILDGNNYQSYWRELDTKNDKAIPPKCIYHILGEAKLENSNWGYNDKQLLHFLKSAYSDYPLKNLTAAIRGNLSRIKTLFILGNNAPDWLFRFILTPIYGGDVYDDGKGFYMCEDGHNENEGLNLFLRDIKFEKESQLINVLTKVTERINTGMNPNRIGNEKEYDFFVAHAGEEEDVVRVRQLVDRLRANNLKVWVDYENIKDGHYWQRILDAIQGAAYFMPFVTEHYIQKARSLKTTQEALSQLSVADLSLDSEVICNLSKLLGGVHVELLIAALCCKRRRQDVYSIPVLLAGENFYEEPITKNRVENWSKDSRLLPEELFWGIQMYEFDVENPDSFGLDFARYRLNH